MSRSDADRVSDIRSAISRCRSYEEHLGSPDLGQMAYDAVLRNLAVIGEAVRALPEEFVSAHPDVPWPAIAGLRNVVVHEYFRVNPDVIRDVLDQHLTTLDEALASDD